MTCKTPRNKDLLKTLIEQAYGKDIGQLWTAPLDAYIAELEAMVAAQKARIIALEAIQKTDNVCG